MIVLIFKIFKVRFVLSVLLGYLPRNEIIIVIKRCAISGAKLFSFVN